MLLYNMDPLSDLLGRKCQSALKFATRRSNKRATLNADRSWLQSQTNPRRKGIICQKENVPLLH